MIENFLILGKSEITNVTFKKHFVKRKILVGLTMKIDVDVNISIGEVKLNTFTIQSDFVLTADEFNEIKSKIGGSSINKNQDADSSNAIGIMGEQLMKINCL